MAKAIFDLDPITAALISTTPKLEMKQERKLLDAWLDRRDKSSLDHLVLAHAQLALKLAIKFHRRFGLSVEDMFQEGQIGLVKAADRFDRSKPVRFTTCAAYWVTSTLQVYVMRNLSLVRLGGGAAQRRLFLTLRAIYGKIAKKAPKAAHHEVLALIAKETGDSIETIELVWSHLTSPVFSLQAPLSDEEGSVTRQDLLPDQAETPDRIVETSVDTQIVNCRMRRALDALKPRSKTIIEQRFLRVEGSTPSLADLGATFNISPERCRQIEAKALSELKDIMQKIEVEDVASRQRRSATIAGLLDGAPVRAKQVTKVR